MQSTRTKKSSLLVLILLVSAVQLIVTSSANDGSMSKVVDPLLLSKTRLHSLEGRVPVMIKVVSTLPLSQSQRTALSSLGTITSSIGRVTSMQIPPSLLEEARAFDFVSSIFFPRTFRTVLDVSAAELGATFVWQNVTDAYGKTVDGSGVAVGIIDTGVDLSHHDLRFPNGTSKVLYLWDQTTTGTPPRGFAYGAECSWDDINNAKCAEEDTFGHGTHVASIAVSSGVASDKYRGVAPGAYLIVVKGGEPMCDGDSWTFEEDAILDGLQYIVERAQALGMRLVVNLSFGGNIGGHDDTSPLELALDYLETQGIVVTAAAGNEANSHSHASGLLAPGERAMINWELTGHASAAMLDIWYPRDSQMLAALTTPSGELIHGPTSDDGHLSSDGRILMTQADTEKGNEILISAQADDGLAPQGWSVALELADVTDPVRWDAWVDSDSCSYPPAVFTEGEGYLIDEAGTVTLPATASGVIAVGAYVSKNAWLNGLGKQVSTPEYMVGQVAPFSSRGPTRDGRTKPDIMAPGLYVAAARSSAVAPGENDPDEYHRVLAGTSMAAPHVAGIAALMLQYNPSLTSTEIRSVIVGGAALDGFTGLIEESNGSTVWGWGKADARTATTLYRVVSTLELLPSEYTVSLTLDSVPFCPLRGGEVLTMRFASGTVHTFQVADQIIVANATRYVVTNYQKVFSANGIFGPTVRTQYLLSLESPLGYARGEGWYDSGSCASPTVSPHALATSHSRFLGVVFFFDYWLDERGNRFSSGCLLMDSPHSARAVWVPRLVDWWPILLILTIAASGLLLFEFRRRRLQG